MHPRTLAFENTPGAKQERNDCDREMDQPSQVVLQMLYQCLVTDRANRWFKSLNLANGHRLRQANASVVSAHH